ncbi:hypothetical protein NC652_020536 [Populus alba x Populus x berolinensis]|nr:hypothetical protein NC652_020536 [Populus alba x Populus x berolinensis]
MRCCLCLASCRRLCCPQHVQTQPCKHCLQWKVLLLRRNRLKNNEYFFFLNTIQARAEPGIFFVLGY